MEGDRGRHGARRGHAQLLERQCHADAGDARAAGRERDGAPDRQRSEPDERGGERPGHIERREHADGRREAGDGGDRRPAEQRRCCPGRERGGKAEPGRPASGACPGDCEAGCEHGCGDERCGERPDREQAARRGARAGQRVDDGPGSGNGEAGASAQPAAVGVWEPAGKEPDPDRFPEPRRQDGVRQRAQPVTAPGLAEAELCAGRA
jgi:hypothetical protein